MIGANMRWCAYAAVCCSDVLVLLSQFDVSVLRSGCVVPPFDFVTKFWATMLFMLLGFVVVMIACAARLIASMRETTALALESRSSAAEDVSPAAADLPERSLVGVWRDLSHRLQHAIIILLAIFYLRLAVLEMETFQCELLPNTVASASSDAVVSESLYLTQDATTLCYVGRHKTVAVVAGIPSPTLHRVIPSLLLCPADARLRE